MEAAQGCVALVRRTPGVPTAPGRRATRTRTKIAALALGLLSTGFLAFGMVGVAAFATVLGLITPLASSHVRTALRVNRLRRAKLVHRHARERALDGSLFGRATLAELTRLADELVRGDPSRADDLEELLDRYTVLTVAHERAMRAVAMADRAQLERIRDDCQLDAMGGARRRELCTRRLRCLADCEATVASIENELAIVSDTVRLLAQQAMLPEIPVRSEVVDRQLAELDEAVAASHECALVCEPEPVSRRERRYIPPPPHHAVRASKPR